MTYVLRQHGLGEDPRFDVVESETGQNYPSALDLNLADATELMNRLNG